MLKMWFDITEYSTHNGLWQFLCFDYKYYYIPSNSWAKLQLKNVSRRHKVVLSLPHFSLYYLHLYSCNAVRFVRCLHLSISGMYTYFLIHQMYNKCVGPLIYTFIFFRKIWPQWTDNKFCEKCYYEIHINGIDHGTFIDKKNTVSLWLF